ncbi:MAG: glycosyltransferase [Phycisphaerales bacterium]|nr:glycosyltransferase [Planctomycetota bacterium]MCH8508453.1 glycosyltransferase [Phycisphaerales bacterium]
MRVGVAIPSYNHARFVAEAVRSVLAQTHADVELVVVDDGSADGSPGVVRDAFAEFPGRPARLIEQENRGAHAAIMRAVEALDTEVVAVLNSDDAYEPDRFERVLPLLARRERAIAFTGLRIIDEHGRDLPDAHPWPRWYATALTAAETEPTIGFALLVHNFSVTSGNFVFTRALYDRLGGFGSQKFAHDWDFLIRSVALTEPEFLPDRLMRYRVHGSNTTESVRGLMEAECADAIDRYRAELASSDATNPLAPCGENWPTYWDRFIRSRRAFWAPHLGRHAIKRASS